MAKRGRQPNLAFFAFTATPKYKTLEVFGQPGPDGKPVPFHLYSMRQAIEEGFILDVLKFYTTYKTYYRLVKSIEDDPEVDKRKAARALARFVSLHPHNIAQKTEVMLEHFRHFTMHRIGGRAKAMVVTSSRLHAVRYKQAFDRYIAEKGYAPWLEHDDAAVRANATICLIHQANFLLDQQVAAVEQQFVKEGGYSEQLAAARLAERNRREPDQTDPTDLIPNCPLCGKPTVLRTVKSGKNAGRQFWGCSAYPKCKGVARA